eukprot:769165-Pleurochrysis_carterae.AAC.5
MPKEEDCMAEHRERLQQHQLSRAPSVPQCAPCKPFRLNKRGFPQNQGNDHITALTCTREKGSGGSHAIEPLVVHRHDCSLSAAATAGPVSGCAGLSLPQAMVASGLWRDEIPQCYKVSNSQCLQSYVKENLSSDYPPFPHELTLRDAHHSFRYLPSIRSS